MERLNALLKQAKSAVSQVEDLTQLEALRVKYLGKKGELTALLKGIAHLPPHTRPQEGQRINQAKRDLAVCMDERAIKLQDLALQTQLKTAWCDVTLPGRTYRQGSLHPVTQMKQKAISFFCQLGFDVVLGSEVETEYYNFEALNIPPHHPARAMHDTFYFGDLRLLRTHTSPVQIHVMEKTKPPIRLIAPGRVYRRDADATHTPMFHQLEGLFIDETVTFAQLRGILQDFLTYLFQKIQVRFRSSYFPFTEPSAEVDISCIGCQGTGCRLCKESGWLEVAGCGMVHPIVLKKANISPTQFQGWAFGVGLDRLALLYTGISDLRTLFENDIEFLAQFV